jgi:glycosyltransferase involved in cell wall biosynthesis
MKTILATAYAVNPYKGSEDGMGWNFVLQIARFNKVVAITRENNRQHIERFMKENPDHLYQNLSFLYFDLPAWMRFWKRGSRGAMLYYWMWQFGIVAFIRKNVSQFDIAHNLNFHNDWTPSHLHKLGKPFVWGPVGHHPKIPTQYLKTYKPSYRIKDRLIWWVKNYFWNYSPALSRTIKEADHIFCMNNSVPKTLRLKNRFTIMPSVATEDFGWDKRIVDGERFTLISAGRFVPLKGFDLSIHSFAAFLNSIPENKKELCELVLVGQGPEEKYFKQLASSYGIEKNLRFISWIERGQLMKLFRGASAFLFPSHEGAGMVVAEALSFGLPVICLDNEGPGQFINNNCGYAIPHGSYSETLSSLAKAIDALYHTSLENREKMRQAARKQFENHFHWNRRGEQLNEIYQSL